MTDATAPFAEAYPFTLGSSPLDFIAKWMFRNRGAGMKKTIFLTLLLTGLLGWLGGGAAFAAEKRIALVIGEAAYKEHPLATAANDAGLVAQTLQAAGFDVTGARDLDEDGLRRALRDFLDKAGASGPETVAFVYFAGLGLQLDGENYLIPVDAAIARDADISLRAARLSDYLKPLAALALKTTVVVLDAARENPFALADQPIAGGLTLFEPGPGLLLAYNAAPGTIAPAEAGPYGAYAHGLAEMIRAGGMPLMQVFDETRLRVSELTKGAQIPWNSAPINSSFLFFERTAQAPARPGDNAALRAKPIAQFGARDAYAACIERDTIQGYQEYLAAYPGDPMAKRVRAILAARREALIWRRARMLDTPEAYWSYLRRYQRGPHVWDARRLLAMRASALEPPPAFQPVDMGYPPPPPEEIIYLEGPELYFDNPAFGFPPPPPPPEYFLPPPPPDFVVLPPPYVIYDPYVLPVPVYVPVPVYILAPAYIAPPPNNVIFENLHNSVMVDRASNNLVIKNPEGHLLSSGALTAVGAGAAGAAIGAALPHFIAKKPAAAPPKPLPPPTGAAAPVGQPPASSAPPAAHQAKPTTPAPAPTTLVAPAPQAQPARKTPAPGTAAPSRERTQEHGHGAPPAPTAPAAPPAPVVHGSSPPKPPAPSPAPSHARVPTTPAAPLAPLVHRSPPPKPPAPSPAFSPARVPPIPAAPPAPVSHGSPPPKPPAPSPAAPLARAPTAPVARPAPPPPRAPTAPAAPTKPHCEMENGKQVCR
jgi:uncharacterized caspase-like protein